MNNTLFLKFADLFFTLSGIKLKDYKKYLLEHRLSKFVGNDKQFKNYEEFYDALTKDTSGKLKTQFIESLTTNWTFFFRENVHFEFLKHYLNENYIKQKYIRLWSAGCSTGEEPYSMAIVSKEIIPDIERFDFKILATDISRKVLEFAIKGEYHFSKIKGALPDHILRKYFIFNKEKKDFTVKDEIKNLVYFRYLNLMDNFPFQKKFDVVFLRNVLIYFDNEEKEYILRKIYDYVKNKGYIILGLSESIVGIKSPFKNFKNSIHRKE